VVESRGARRFVSVYGFPVLTYISCLVGDYEAGLLIFIREREKEIRLVLLLSLSLSLSLFLSSSYLPKVEYSATGKEEIDFSGLETQFGLFRNDVTATPDEGLQLRKEGTGEGESERARARRVDACESTARMYGRAPSACTIRNFRAWKLTKWR